MSMYTKQEIILFLL